jgi:hypothetical protein
MELLHPLLSQNSRAGAIGDGNEQLVDSFPLRRTVGH